MHADPVHGSCMWESAGSWSSPNAVKQSQKLLCTIKRARSLEKLYAFSSFYFQSFYVGTSSTFGIQSFYVQSFYIQSSTFSHLRSVIYVQSFMFSRSTLHRTILKTFLMSQVRFNNFVWLCDWLLAKKIAKVGHLKIRSVGIGPFSLSSHDKSTVSLMRGNFLSLISPGSFQVVSFAT